MLLRHYQPENAASAGVFAPEIGSPCGKRRADALWAPFGVGAKGIIGHEIKVSRSDLLAELADPAKADPWARYCAEWWLVVSDPALVEGLMDRIPEVWGVMAPPSGRRTRSMTVLRPATWLVPIDQAPAYKRILTWHFDRAESRVRKVEGDASWKDTQIARHEETIRTLRESGGTSDHVTRNLMKIAQAVQSAAVKRGIYSFSDYNLEELADAIADSVIDAEGVRLARETTLSSLRRTIDAAERILHPLARAAKELAKLEASA